MTYLMARLWVLRGDPAEVRRLVVASVTAGTLGAGVGLAFWLPVLRTIDLAGLAAGRAAKPAIPHPVLRLVLPGEAWGTKDSLYVGLVTVAWVVSAFRTESRRRAWPLALVAASALVLSLGPDTALWRALTVLPGFSAVDQANVLSWPFAVFVATLAGLGLPSEAEVSTRRHATLITVAWPLLVADLSILALRGWIEPSRWDLARNVRGRAVVASPRECALVAPPLDDRPHRVLVIERFSPEDELVLWRNDALRLGCIEDVRASAHLGSPRLRRMLRELGPWPVDWDSFSDVRARAPTSLTLAEESRATRVLDLLGVDTVVTDVDVSGVAFERLAGEPALARWIRTDPLPRYRLVAHAEVVNGEEAAADRVLARSFDPRDAVVLEDEARDLSASAPEDRAARPARPAPVRIDRHRPGDILLHSESRPGDVLVVGETWLPGWRATVDGHPATLVRANYLHMALAPPAGSHSIHLTYSPPGLALGVAIASISATLSIVLVVRPPRPRRS
ncbi:MAG: YfhO family protein [Deltaproteobacteria bacterium]|nr:YfhO family protein [Deltaproteobacteria bacterium]